MIPVTPRQGRQIMLNADLIESIEAEPATVIVLAGGRRIPVLDSPQELVERIGIFRASVLAAVDEMVTGHRSKVIPLPQRRRDHRST